MCVKFEFNRAGRQGRGKKNRNLFQCQGQETSGAGQTVPRSLLIKQKPIVFKPKHMVQGRGGASCKPNIKGTDLKFKEQH